jgi:flavin-binding protein dodecin
VHHPHHAEESLNREENHRQDDSSSSLLELHPDTVGSKGSRTSTPRDAALTSTSPHSSTSAAKDAATRNDTTLSSHVNTHEVMNRLKQLEMQLTGQKATPPSQPQSSAATPAESIRLSTDKAGDAHLQYDSTLFGDFDMTVKSTTHKARLFGTSHWINIILSV